MMRKTGFCPWSRCSPPACLVRLTESCTAYMSQYSAVWKNQRTGQWRNFKFNIIQC